MSDRSALVTGATRGIGRGIATSLAAKGFGLTVTARKDEELRALASDLLEAGAAQVVHMPLDLAHRDELPSLVELHQASYGSMSALIVNAGVGTAGPVIDLPIDRIDKTLDVNLVSAMVLVKESLPLLRIGASADAAHGATVVGLSSITGAFPEAGLAMYGASKAALMSFLETVNLEESGNGVTATSIAPGYVATDMSAWTTDTIPAATMIPVADVVAVVDMLIDLGRTTSIPRIVLTRSGTSGHVA